MEKHNKLKRLLTFGLAFTMAASLSCMSQSPAHASNKSFFEDDSGGDENVSLTRTLGEMEGTATFLSGTAFNKKIKQIAGNESAVTMTIDRNIESIRWADPSDMPEEARDNVVSTNSSELPIYAWFENGVLYLSTEAETKCLNTASNFMFYGLEELTDVSALEEIDSSNAESMVNMLAGCKKVEYVNLNSFSISDGANMDGMFDGMDMLSRITLGENWKFSTAASIPKMNWENEEDRAVWTYAALETRFDPGAAGTYFVSDADATVLPDEELFEGDGLHINNMYPVGKHDDLSSRFTGFCINDKDQVPYGYYRRVEITPEEVVGEEWLQSADFGCEPIGDDMRQALITLILSGSDAMESGTMDFDSLQKDIWHFTNHYSDKQWDGSFWIDKNFHDIEKHQITKLFLYESLEGHQNVLSAEGIEIVEPVEVNVAKVDEDGNLITGAVLELTGTLYNDAAGEKSEKVGPVTIASEELDSNPFKLYPGDYVLTEKEVPDGFQKADDIIFSISLDGDIICDDMVNEVITMVDEKIIPAPVETDVTISKQDIIGKEIAGAELKVSDKDGNMIDQWISEEGKSHVIEGLKEGTYTLTESLAPVGYEKASDITFVIGKDGKLSVSGKEAEKITMTDDYTKYDIAISKQDISGKEIAGASLSVTDADGKTVDEWISEEGKQHFVKGLLKGKYTLTEKLAPEGYETAESIQFEVTFDGKVLVASKETDCVVMVDAVKEPEGHDVVISKQDIAGKEIEGAKLELADKDGNVIEAWTSEAGKSREIKNLPAGEYTLTEKTAPEGYEIAENVIFSVDSEGIVTVDKKDVAKVVMVDDYKKYDVLIRKVENYKSIEKMVTGAELTILDSDNKAVISWTSGEEAKKVSLIAGKYTLTETKAPTGYELAEDIAFTVGMDGKVTLDGEKEPLKKAEITMVDLANDGTHPVIIRKTDDDGDDLSGAALKITHKDKNGKVVIDEQWKSSGKKEIRLVPGSYILREEEAPKGYVLSDDITFVVKSDGSVTVDNKTVKEVVMKDAPTTVGIVKKDKDTGELVEGAKLQILDKTGKKVMDEWTSGKDTHYVTAKLEAGSEYILHESSAPDGYETADDVHFTVNKDAETLTVEMFDKAKVVEPVEYGTLEVKKTVEGSGADKSKKFGFIVALMDANNNPFTGKLNYVMSDGAHGTLQFDRDGRAGFELSHGQYIIFENVQAGYFYTVTELDYSKDGYTASVDDSSAETKKGENIISFTNTYGVQAVDTSAGVTSANSNTTSGTIVTSRDTGDASHVVFWSIVFAVCAVFGISAFALKKKKKSK